MTDAWLGFASGVGLTLFTAAVTVLVDHHKERRRKKREINLFTYMTLLQITQIYDVECWPKTQSVEELKRELEQELGKEIGPDHPFRRQLRAREELLRNQEKERLSMRIRMNEACTKLQDKIREIGPPDHMDEVIKVLFEESFDTAMERARAMDDLITCFAAKVAPELSHALRRSTETSLQRFAKDRFDTNAPVNLWKASHFPRAFVEPGTDSN